MRRTKHNRVLMGVGLSLICMAAIGAPSSTGVLTESPKAASISASAQSESLYRRAQELFRSRRYDEAKRLFEQVRAQAGDYRQTAFFLSEIQRLKSAPSGEGGQGQTIAPGGGISSSEAVSRLLVEGRRALKEGNLEEARQHFRQVVVLDSGNAEAKRYLDQLDGRDRRDELVPTTARLDLPAKLPVNEGQSPQNNDSSSQNRATVAQQVKKFFSRELEPAQRVSRRDEAQFSASGLAQRSRVEVVGFEQPVIASMREGGIPSVRGEKKATAPQEKASKEKETNLDAIAHNAPMAVASAKAALAHADTAASALPQKNRETSSKDAATRSQAEPKVSEVAKPVATVSELPSQKPTGGAEAVLMAPGTTSALLAQADASSKTAGKTKVDQAVEKKDLKPQEGTQRQDKAEQKSDASARKSKDEQPKTSHQKTESEKDSSSAKATNPKVEADTLVREAQRLLKAGKREEAWATVQKALEKDPANIEAKALAKDLEKQVGQKKESAKQVEDKPVVLSPLQAAEKPAEAKKAEKPAKATPTPAVAKAEQPRAKQVDVAKATKPAQKKEEATVAEASKKPRSEAARPSAVAPAMQRPAPSQDESEKAAQAEAAFQKGLVAYQDGQLDVAVQWWNYALTLVPNHERALQYLQQTRAEYDAWVQKHQANAVELQKEASTNAKLDTPITFDTAGPKSLTEFLSALSLITDISFYIADGVDPDVRITAKFEEVPLRDALDTTLLPIGLKWSQSGEVIAVTPDLKTKFFNLTP
ncbi:MAG: hypothetical protein ACP5QZ_05480, partial [Candidatus Sumerlaeaceae bacterium]